MTELFTIIQLDIEIRKNYKKLCKLIIKFYKYLEKNTNYKENEYMNIINILESVLLNGYILTNIDDIVEGTNICNKLDFNYSLVMTLINLEDTIKILKKNKNISAIDMTNTLYMTCSSINYNYLDGDKEIGHIK